MKFFNFNEKTALFGLGNPGEKYKHNRHNIGYIVLEQFASSVFDEENCSTNKKLEACIYNKINHPGKDLILAKPATFMNNSGRSVEKTISYYRIKIKNILIVHDDIDIPFGEIRFSKNAGPGGHNGIKSIIEHLGTKDFARLRVGIANNNYQSRSIPSEKFVLENFNKKEQEFLGLGKGESISLAKKISEAMLFYIDNGFEKTKDKYNKSAMPLIEA